VSRPESPEGEDGRREERHRCGPIYHENQPPQISSLGALSCSHQLSEETQDEIKRNNEHNEAGTKWKLDLMISDTCLKPTWLALPVPPKYVKSLDLDVRVFEPKDWDSRPCVEGRYLLHVLRSFFRYSPCLTRGPRDLSTLEHGTMLSDNMLGMKNVLAQKLFQRDVDHSNHRNHDPLPRDPTRFVSLMINVPCAPGERGNLDPQIDTLSHVKSYIGWLTTIMVGFT